jgi:Fur family iron response transcriptional regulator
MNERPYAPVISLLQRAGLRPTRQRMGLARLLFERGDRHVTAEELYEETRAAKIPVSLATVYNTLHQFTRSGLLREVAVEPGRTYFDTNTSRHHHFYFEASGSIQDIPEDEVSITQLPDLPAGTELDRIDIVVRVASRGAKKQ